ncbi:MAG: hypothetical protein ACR2NX_05830 [Chthoniobacterales bacterium]
MKRLIVVLLLLVANVFVSQRWTARPPQNQPAGQPAAIVIQLSIAQSDRLSAPNDETALYLFETNPFGRSLGSPL